MFLFEWVFDLLDLFCSILLVFILFQSCWVHSRFVFLSFTNFLHFIVILIIICDKTYWFCVLSLWLILAQKAWHFSLFLLVHAVYTLFHLLDIFGNVRIQRLKLFGIFEGFCYVTFTIYHSVEGIVLETWFYFLSFGTFFIC